MFKMSTNRWPVQFFPGKKTSKQATLLLEQPIGSTALNAPRKYVANNAKGIYVMVTHFGTLSVV